MLTLLHFFLLELVAVKKLPDGQILEAGKIIAKRRIQRFDKILDVCMIFEKWLVVGIDQIGIHLGGVVDALQQTLRQIVIQSEIGIDMPDVADEIRAASHGGEMGDVVAVNADELPFFVFGAVGNNQTLPLSRSCLICSLIRSLWAR